MAPRGEAHLPLPRSVTMDGPLTVMGNVMQPPLSLEEDEAVVRMINDSKPDVLWVALGCPRQERWIYEHRDRLHVPVAIGIGAAFKFMSGTVERAPEWVGNLGFEWLWRFVHEPCRLWRRVLIDGPRFVFSVGLEELGIRKFT